MKLQGRGVVITGGSQGFGKAVAEACVAEGADVLVCARGAAELEDTCCALRASSASGQRIASQVVDVSDPDSATRLIEAAQRELPRFTGLVNNAGIYGPK